MRVGVALTTIRFHSLAPMYYRGAQAAIVVYDITMPVCGQPQELSAARASE